MYVITGGAGFIGSNIAAALDQQGADIVISDWMGANDFKWRNIAKRRLLDIIPPEATGAFLDANREKIAGVFHMGAISTTTETDIDAIVRNNFRLSIDLWTWCSQANIPLVYASSAATYGDGREGFLDRFDADYLSRLRPLNRLWVEQGPVRPLGPACGRDRRVRVPRAGRVSNSSTSTGRTNITRAASARSPLSCTRRSASPVGSVCSAPRTPTIPTAASCAILSGSGTVSEWRSGRFRNRARNPAFTMSVPEQRDPFSRWRKSCSRKWASLPTSSSSISRLHYGANINIIPVEASISCDRRVMRRRRPASKMG